jgi:hypothetical protein
MMYFAYDGTIHGDWVSHYAVRLAARHPDRELRLLYVDEGRIERSQLDDKLAQIDAACSQRDVGFHVTTLTTSATVFNMLPRQIPDGPSTYVVCGTRSRRSKLGVLSGTMSERLLRAKHCHVLAIRVNQPGVLGLPKDLLAPVAGHPRGFQSGLPFMELFRPDVSRVHILFVRRVSGGTFECCRTMRPSGCVWQVESTANALNMKSANNSAWPSRSWMPALWSQMTCPKKWSSLPTRRSRD